MTGLQTFWLALRTATTGVVCLAAAVAADWLNVPLAWILGPMIAAAVLSLAGFKFWFPYFGQRIGQCTIGTSVGLKLTGSALAMLVPLVPLMFIVGLLGMCFGAFASLLLVRFANLDSKTAYFAMMPGGLAEMANIAETVGARGEPVALIQALRLAIVVSVLPPIVLALGVPGDSIPDANPHFLALFEIAAIFAIAAVGIMIAQLLRFNNHWMIGAMLGAGVASTTGLITGTMPEVLVHAGQVLLGVAIGARFKRDIVGKLLGIAVVAVFAIVATLILLFGSGLALTGLTHGDIATSVLATAPGGLPEMAVTAQVLQLNVAFVMTFQLVRAFLVNGFAVHLMSGLERLGFFRISERLKDK